MFFLQKSRILSNSSAGCNIFWCNAIPKAFFLHRLALHPLSLFRE